MRFIDPCGIRTQPLQIESLATSPEVERAMLYAHRMRKVGREVAVFHYRPRCSASFITRWPRLLLQIFSPPLIRLSYRPDPTSQSHNEKSPMSQRHRALEVFSEYGQASQAQNLGGELRSIIGTGRLIDKAPCTQGFAYET